ncbi:Transposase (plasmid) [Labrenzia sp. THAF191b]|nr:Transposase [Labrenzia sp. THAF191b]QFT07860.1 Transposase [Labrenzia sp. THAF191a]QFT19274.1 Transposase [Labrenzia sp. THAF187b]
MEACGSAHYWGRELARLGHKMKLIPPIYVKPFVKRQKNDAADAEAICEAANRPTMRFVPVKSEERQGIVVLLRTREILIRQPTQTINALRGHLAEFGVIVPKGASNVAKLIERIASPETSLPEVARAALSYSTDSLLRLEDQVRELDRKIADLAKADETAQRLMTIPGIGPLIAVAMAALAPPPETFRRGRDFAAWL